MSKIRTTEQKRKKPTTNGIGSSLGMDMLANLPPPKLPENTRVVVAAETPMMCSEPAQEKKKVCILGRTTIEQKREGHVAAMKLAFSDTLISSRPALKPLNANLTEEKDGLPTATSFWLTEFTLPPELLDTDPKAAGPHVSSR